MSQNDPIKPQIAKLYPDLSSGEIEEVETTLRNYLTVVCRIFGQVSRHDKQLLTELGNRAKVRKERQKGA